MAAGVCFVVRLLIFLAFGLLAYYDLAINIVIFTLFYICSIDLEVNMVSSLCLRLLNFVHIGGHCQILLIITEKDTLACMFIDAFVDSRSFISHLLIVSSISIYQGVFGDCAPLRR